MSVWIDLDRISLGADGRAILDDDALAAFANDGDLVLAGGDDKGTTNQSSCLNSGNCTGSQNTNCTNSGTCTDSSNFGCRGRGGGGDLN
ncbi:MAG: hypothetical protein JWP35_2743 [Caulobacter sp.]|jgi:hypothetical protein|nr:hypothetical protein [Caulobacter sp.]